ncbi:K02A2.6-like, partial [Cordylochernes scorpioides]
MAQKYNCVAPEPFNFSNPGDWPKWIRRFERFRQASGLINNPENEQVNMLVYCMGDNADDILLSCKIASDQLEKYDEVIKCFESHFIPRRNIIYERARFNQRCQQEGERVNDFITALHSLAEHCNFGALYDELIRDRIVVGVRDRALSEKMQLDTDLTLVKATQMAKQSESVKEQQSSLYQQNFVDQIKKMPNRIKESKKQESEIRQFKSNQSGRSSRGCTRCGNANNHDWKNCPAMNSYCNKCNRKGHYAKVCRSVAINKVKSEITFLGSVEIESSKKCVVPIKVNNRQINFKIDTGTDVNVLSFQQYCQSFQRIKLEKSDKILQGPNGIPLKTVGMIHVILQNKGQHLNSKIYIVDKLKQPLLSRAVSGNRCAVAHWCAAKNFRCAANIFMERFLIREGASDKQNQNENKEDKKIVKSTGNKRKYVEDYLKYGFIPSVNDPSLPFCLICQKTLSNETMVPSKLLRHIETNHQEQMNNPISYFENIRSSFQKQSKKFKKFMTTSDEAQTASYMIAQLIARKKKAHAEAEEIILPALKIVAGCMLTNDAMEKVTKIPLSSKTIARRIEDMSEDIELQIKQSFIDSSTKWAIQLDETTDISNKAQLLAFLRFVDTGKIVNNYFFCKELKQRTTGADIFELVDENVMKYNLRWENCVSVCTDGAPAMKGIVNYLGKFIPNLANKIQPLNSLLSTKNEWVWEELQKKSFNLLKQELASRPNLALYNPSRLTIISADASSFGIGGVLRQEQPDGSLKPVAYVSRTLSETEKRYSQIEKEGLAIVWTCDRLKDYVTGIKIHIETDHKTLIAIFTPKPLEDITPRLQRLKMRMMRYSYQISHIAGKKQIVADLLSRKPISKRHEDELGEELSAYIQSIEFPATEERLLEISRKQKEDSLCSQVANYCTGGWPKNKKEVDPEIRGYWQFQDDLTYQNGLLLRGQRILIPRSMRKEILEKLHQGHFGINKCRSRAKESVWWLGISQEIERMVSSCIKCLKERRPKHEALMPSEFPIRPWQKVGMDLFYLNGRWYLIVCDYYSRYPEISLLQNLTAKEVINRLKSIFARHGTPETVRSDNGPQFQKVLGSEFSRFSKEWSFKHITSSPRFPQSNGFIEAIIKNIKQSLKKEEDCYLTLQAYRTMPLENGYSPAELSMGLSMGRRLRTSVPAIESSLMPRYLDSKALQEREKWRMINQKRLYDERHDVHSLPQLQQGDSVWIRDQRVEGKVLHKSQEPRSYWVQTPQGKVRRNWLHLTRLPTKESTMDAPEDSRRQELRNEEPPPPLTSTGQTRKCKDDQDQETEEDCPTSKTPHTREGRTRSENQDQDQERSLPSTPVVQTRYGRVNMPRRSRPLIGRNTAASRRYRNAIAIETPLQSETRRALRRLRYSEARVAAAQTMQVPVQRIQLWTHKPFSGLQYNTHIDYKADSSVDIGQMSRVCQFCSALRFRDEPFGLCCKQGRVSLPAIESPPEPIFSLLSGLHPLSKSFLLHIRRYNSIFQMTSFGARQVVTVNMHILCVACFMRTRSGLFYEMANADQKPLEAPTVEAGVTTGGDAGFDPIPFNPSLNIRKYAGDEDPRQWIISLEEVGFLYRWADYIITRYAAMNLVGPAKTCMNSTSKVQPNMEEMEKIQFVIGGLKKEYALALYLNPPKTIDELLEACKKIDGFEKEYLERKEKNKILMNRISQKETNHSGWNRQPREFQSYKTENYSRPMMGAPRQNQTYFPPQETRTFPRSTQKDTYRRTPSGNTYDRKPRNDRGRTEDGRPICFRCNRPGHVAKYCRIKYVRMVGEVPPSLDSPSDDKKPLNTRNLSPEVYADVCERPSIPTHNRFEDILEYDIVTECQDSNEAPRKIINQQDEVVPQLCVKLVRVTVKTGDGEYVVEPNERLTLTNGLRIARCLITVRNKLADLWITNPYPRTLKIMKNQTLGYASPPTTVNYIENDEEDKVTEIQISEDLTLSQKNELRQVLSKYSDLFSSKLGKTNLAKHRIDTENAKPIKHKPYRVSPKERDIIKEQIQDMLQEGVIRASSSPWAFPVILVRNRDGNWRFCVDYRKLNSITVKDVYPIPRIDDVMDTLQGSRYFTAIDLRSGYWQVEIEEQDKKKTAFTTSHGLYEFNVMPFGLCNAPATFERIMDNVLKNIKWKFCLCYLDDVVIYSPDFTTHLGRIEAVLKCFRESNLRLNGKKKFIKNFSRIADPLFKLTRKDSPFIWSESQEEAFITLKSLLTNPPILSHFDPEAPTQIHTDASNIGLGATLVQTINGQEKVISYISRSLSKPERNYSTTEKECLALVWSMSKLRPYLYGRRFKVMTDHHALCWLRNLRDPTGRLARWALKIQEYDFEIIYKSGKKHLDADGLSRGPLPEADFDDNYDSLFFNPVIEDSDEYIENIKRCLGDTEGRRSIVENFKEENGCLYKRNPRPEGRAWLLVVPRGRRKDILKEYHNHMICGHLGVTRTMHRLKDKYFWPSMLKDVVEYVRTCHLCQSRKGSNQLPAGLLHPIPAANYPFERVGIDFLGPLPSTKNRKKWMIVLTDYYTKYAETKAVIDATAREVAKFLTENVILKHGAPRYLISDRGSQFTSNLVKEITKICQIQHCLTTSYHPQTNGLTERLNRTLINLISMYVNVDQRNWDEILPFITHAYNTTIQETTKYSPFFLLYGREPVSILDDTNIFIEPDSEDYDEYVSKLMEKIVRTREIVKVNTEKSQEKMINHYNQKHRQTGYEPGDLVALWTPIRKPGKCEKLLRRYFGPYIVLKKISDVNYSIVPEDNPGNRTQPTTVHISRIKPYFARMEDGKRLINNPENEQVNMLVYCMGDNADDILLSCKIASDQLENYGKVIECFESHFIPRRNIIYERARFNQRCQQEGEKVNEFITALHSLAEHCNFGMLHDELIRDRIVVGVRDRALSERMQLDTDLTLVKATLMAKQLESVKEQQSSLYQQDSVDQIKKMPNHIKEAKRHEPKIRQFKSNQLGGSSHGCTRCGNSNNHDWKNCPAMNSYCSKCKKKGHYAKVCRSEAINEIKSEIAFLGSVEDNSKKWIVPIKQFSSGGRGGHRGRLGSGDNRGCYNCGEEGHRKFECTKPARGGGRSRGQSRDGGSNNTCYNCGEVGHRKYECTNNTAEDGGQEENQRKSKKACYTCGEFGHKKDDCPKNGTQESGDEEESSDNEEEETPRRGSKLRTDDAPGKRQEQRNEEIPTSTSTWLSRRCKDDQEQETEEDCPTPTASSTRNGRMQRDNQDQDPEKSLPSMPAVHTRYGRKMEQGREEDPKEPMESDPDSESGGNPTFPKKENTLGKTQEIAPGQEDVTPPPPVSDVLGRLTRTRHQLSAVTGHRERWNRYDGSYEAQSFFTNYDAQADRAQLQYSTRLRKPPNLLQAPLRVTNTR